MMQCAQAATGAVLEELDQLVRDVALIWHKISKGDDSHTEF